MGTTKTVATYENITIALSTECADGCRRLAEKDGFELYEWIADLCATAVSEANAMTDADWAAVAAAVARRQASKQKTKPAKRAGAKKARK